MKVSTIIKSLREDVVREKYAMKGRLIPQAIYSEIKTRKRCKICGKARRHNKFFEVDHKIPHSQGGGNNIENLQALCHECHQAKTEQERRQYEKERDTKLV